MQNYLILVFAAALAGPALAVDFQQVPGVIASVAETCEPCADFYRTDRPLGFFVEHSSVGARVYSDCEGGVTVLADTQYGLSKGDVDLQFFTAQLDSGETSRGLRYFGTVCGREALGQGHAAAAETTDSWIRWQADPANYAVDIIFTPLLGRPCGNAADDVEAVLAEYVGSAR